MKKFSAKKWILSFFCLFLAIAVFFSAVTYAVDPFLQFRVRDNTYVLKDRYVCEGLIKNYDYDTLIIGSSLTQNFDMELFRQELGGKPLHIGVGGINETELIDLLNLAGKKKSPKKYYICIDTYMFTHKNEVESKLPDYLMKDDFISRLKYFTSYESWFRFMPIDVAVLAMKKLNIPVPEKILKETSIDNLENWEGDFPYGEEAVISNYKSGAYAVSKVETQNLYNITVKNIDYFFSSLNFDNGAEYTLFFPPYSSLFWANSKKEGYFDTYLKIERYFYEQAKRYGFEVYDFQGADFTSDLSNYRDTSHFSQKINDLMIKCFKTGDYKLTDGNIDETEEKIKINTDEFMRTHSDLFN